MPLVVPAAGIMDQPLFVAGLVLAGVIVYVMYLAMHD